MCVFCVLCFSYNTEFIRLTMSCVVFSISRDIIAIMQVEGIICEAAQEAVEMKVKKQGDRLFLQLITYLLHNFKLNLSTSN